MTRLMQSKAVLCGKRCVTLPRGMLLLHTCVSHMGLWVKVDPFGRWWTCLGVGWTLLGGSGPVWACQTLQTLGVRGAVLPLWDACHQSLGVRERETLTVAVTVMWGVRD